jgi:type IV pilus assembly protein PilY1
MKTAHVLLYALLAMLAAASTGAPQLAVPHGRPGQRGIAGPSALWQGDDGAAFLIETSGNLRTASGTLQRRSLRVQADGTLAYGAAPMWEASSLLEPGAGRAIFTSAPSGATVAFGWASLPPAWRALLDAGDGRGPLRTAFVRGEQGPTADPPLRPRASLLGDIVHSVPLIVGPPPAMAPSDGHAAFRAQFRERALTVYAGANDGMLHAFSAATGAELFAYIPAALIDALPALADPAYRARPYVDGSAAQADARIGGAWRSVLVAGMGMGARGVFALDITDPARFAGGRGALWEFGALDDPAMGHLRAPPLMARISAGPGGARSAPDDYAVLPSGMNNLSSDGSGALFLLRLDKPAAAPWKAGSNYFRIGTRGSNALLANALSAPALVVQSDGSATRAYAGDLHGNLWRFDFATLSAHRLFTARDAAGAAQPIAHAPKVVFAPGGGYLLVFATGKLIEEGDLLPPSFTAQSVYAILDAPAMAPDSTVSRADLAVRHLASAGTGFAIDGAAFSYAGPDAKKGWTFDFPDARSDGERAAGSPVSFASALAIASIAPGAADAPGGGSRLYLLDALSGFAYDAGSGALPGAATGKRTALDTALPLIVLDSGRQTGPRNPTGGALTTHRVTLLTPAQAGAAPPALQFEVRYPSGRLGWREVINWQELHQRARGARR